MGKSFHRAAVISVFNGSWEADECVGILRNTGREIFTQTAVEAVDYNSMVVLILSMDMSGQAAEHMLKDSFGEFIRQARVLLDMELNVYLGHEVYSMRELPCSYRSAMVAYERSLGSREPQEFYMDELTLAGQNNMAFLDELHLMLGYFVNQEFILANQVIARVFKIYSRERKPYQTVINGRLDFFRNTFIQAVEAAITNNAPAIKVYLRLQKELEVFGSPETVCRIYQNIAQLAQEAVAQRRERLLGPAVEIRALVDDNYTNPELDITMISQKLGYSASYLSRIFKGAYGFTILSYVTQLRLERAKELLKDTDMNVKDIALQSGYIVPETFTRAFRKACGVSPDVYRRKKR